MERTDRGTHTPRVRIAPEYYTTILVLLVAQDLVQLHGEAVQMANVQRAKVTVEGVVEESLVNGEVHRRVVLGTCGLGGRLGPRLRLGRPLARRALFSGIREWRIGIRRVCV